LTQVGNLVGSNYIIPDSISRFGDYCFAGDISLSYLRFNSTSNLSFLGDYVCSGCQTMTSFGYSNQSSYIVPSSL